jgi:general secretion pathway protein I
MSKLAHRHSGRAPVSAGGRGFTLLELLLAFVVFALSFATVLEILSGSMRNTVRARHYTEAALTAQSVMDQVGLEIPLEAGYSADGESGDYRWEIDIFAYEDATEGFNAVELAEVTGIELLQIDLLVSWGEPPREQSSEFSTVRAMLANRPLTEQR